MAIRKKNRSTNPLRVERRIAELLQSGHSYSVLAKRKSMANTLRQVSVLVVLNAPREVLPCSSTSTGLSDGFD
jgi:hypothetical protein